MIAQKIGQTRLSVHGVCNRRPSSHLGSCAGDYLCSYMSTFLWRTPTQPLPMELNPRVVFERMFGSDASTKEERSLQLSQNTKHFDGVSDSIKGLAKGLGPRMLRS